MNRVWQTYSTKSKRTQILSMLVESMSMRSVSRITGVSINTVSKLLVDADSACAEYHDNAVRNVKAERVQCDVIWFFAASEQKNVKDMKALVDGAGDAWTWTAIDADSKLIISYLVGGRGADYASEFMTTLHPASPIASSSRRTTIKHTLKPSRTRSLQTLIMPCWSTCMATRLATT